jgi:hypothetical protein
MATDEIVQFVSFETALDCNGFLKEWEKFIGTSKGKDDIILQQSQKKSGFRYIAQHHGDSEFNFNFAKAKASRTPTEPVRLVLLGGYNCMQSQRTSELRSNESKVFLFLTSAQADVNSYKKLSPGKLNIYEAYYENCKYAYIFEYFVSANHISDLMEQLKLHGDDDAGVYTKCLAGQTA